MELNITTSGCKVLAHGDVFLYDANSDMKIDLKADSGFEFSVVLKFIDDSRSKQGLNKRIDNNTIIYECINFNSLGTGTTVPLSIATISGKEWFIHFWAYMMSDKGPRRVEYTILEKE